MAFHPYPQLIPPVFNLGGFGPPHALTRASTWPWVDHPASGPERATTLALFGLALATATPHGLTSRHATDSQAHSSKGTPPPPHTTSMAGSDGLQAPGFRYYFTPLPGYFSPFPHGTIHYRSSGGIQAAKWSWQIHTGFHEPRATRATPSQTRTNQFRLRGYHPLRHAFPDNFGYRPAHAPGLRQKTTGQPHNPAHATPAEYHTHTVSPSSAFARHYSRNIFSYGY